MYVPEHFRESRIETLHALIREHSFGMLVSTLDGAPFATHLPFLIDAERGPQGTLVGHMARANPHWRAFAGPDARMATGESLVIFSGLHAYVSPSWYETPVAVPTWNYAAVHVYGTPRVVDDDAAVAGLLARTVDTYESGFESPWRIDRLSGDVVERMAKNIVAFELPIARIEGKLKLSQNRSAADRRRVIQALQASGAPGDLDLAELMVLHSFPETEPQRPQREPAMETTAPAGSATSDANTKTSGNGAATGQRSAPAPAPPLPPAAPLRSGALPQTFYNPTRLIWGEGAAAQVGPHAAKLGAKKALVVSDPGVVRAGIPKPVVESLIGAGLEAEVYDAVEPDPRIEIVEKALDHYQKGGFDVLVAVGGGSAMDTAKAVAILATNPGPLRQYEGWEKFPNTPAPLFALPTTVGTASEVTPFLVITDAAAKFKFTIGSPQAAPKIAFLDPLLVLGLPGSVTAATGMDALTHAIESYTSLLSTPISEGLALHAIRLLSANIRAAVANSHNVVAMNAMLVGANVAGLAFSNTRLGNVHACAHPLGAFWKIPHGVANALMLPHVMEFNALASPMKMIEIAQAMGEPIHIGVGGQTEYDAALRAALAVRRMMGDVGIPQRLRDLGVDKASIPDMAQDAMKSANIAINPRKTTINEIIGLYERAW